MGWIEIKGLAPGWWKCWKLWLGIIGALVLFGSVVMAIELNWPAWIFIFHGLAFFGWALAIGRARRMRYRWDTQENRYIEELEEPFDGGGPLM